MTNDKAKEASGGPVWGQQAEEESQTARARLLADMPAEVQGMAERILLACEKDFDTWLYAVTSFGLIAMARELRKTGEVKGEPNGLVKDLMAQSLAVYRSGILASGMKFALETADKEGGDLESVVFGMLVEGQERVKREAKRLSMLLELTKEETAK